MAEVKASLVVTVLNEERSIESFLDSVAQQTLKPNEFIVVDGGSVDWTVEKLGKSKVKAIIIVKDGANRSVGRNIGVQNAKNEIIAVTDAGCLLDKNWFSEITKPFLNENVDVVSGYYLPKSDTIFQKCLAPFVCVMPSEIEKRMKKKNFEFLPSSRSFAFRKVVWGKVGGYPEEMNFCEDLVFDQKIKQSGFKFHFSRKAIVFWPQRKNLKAAFRQFFNYASGDGQVFFSHYQTHSLKISLVFLRYFFFVFLFFLGWWFNEVREILFWLFILYLGWAVAKNYRHVKDWRAFYWLPIIQITSDIAIISGVINGLLKIKLND